MDDSSNPPDPKRAQGGLAKTSLTPKIAQGGPPRRPRWRTGLQKCFRNCGICSPFGVPVATMKTVLSYTREHDFGLVGNCHFIHFSGILSGPAPGTLFEAHHGQWGASGTLQGHSKGPGPVWEDWGGTKALHPGLHSYRDHISRLQYKEYLQNTTCMYQTGGRWG